MRSVEEPNSRNRSVAEPVFHLYQGRKHVGDGVDKGGANDECVRDEREGAVALDRKFSQQLRVEAVAETES